MGEVKIIEVRKNRINRSSDIAIAKLRTSAYCRVSTNSEEQLNSYHSQVEHYKSLISQNKEWEFVDIYADEAVSGTQTIHREEFQRMIHDAQMSKKSVWSCKTAIRKGKKSCTDCKSIEESIIENAFVKAFNTLYTKNKAVV